MLFPDILSRFLFSIGINSSQIVEIFAPLKGLGLWMYIKLPWDVYTALSFPFTYSDCPKTRTLFVGLLLIVLFFSQLPNFYLRPIHFQKALFVCVSFISICVFSKILDVNLTFMSWVQLWSRVEIRKGLEHDILWSLRNNY